MRTFSGIDCDLFDHFFVSEKTPNADVEILWIEIVIASSVQGLAKLC